MLDPHVGHRRMTGSPSDLSGATRAARSEISEEEAQKLLLAQCFGQQGPYCPRCREAKVYRLAAGRLRCSACRYTFQEFSGRFINNGGHSPAEWIHLARHFADESSANQAALDLGLSYNTTYKAFTAIRFAILAQSLDAAQVVSEKTGLSSYVRGKKLTGVPDDRPLPQIPVFGILEKNGWVFIDLLNSIQAETVIFHFGVNFRLGLVRAGNVVYTDRYKHYDTLILCGDDSLPLEYIKKPDRTPFVDASPHGFWRFARERLKRFKGVSCRRFPLYLKELEFRYNHRDKDLLPLVLERLCSLVPDFE